MRVIIVLSLVIVLGSELIAGDYEPGVVLIRLKEPDRVSIRAGIAVGGSPMGLFRSL